MSHKPNAKRAQEKRAPLPSNEDLLLEREFEAIERERHEKAQRQQRCVSDSLKEVQ